ncbi:clathrin adaptor, mu subunit [Coemansia reversa NRRL 1564]|uniref:Clathrin adaptor, mu subunit n=1 Tax=Coemansia reversa (strain ATCC 12441 / NRRL 1564) TaxID=763665 RepID=A0A2G5B5E8_COERN|nr:clathrin adaptor, mu subunit [Coemansia reversa NRRL 1564]|eukprot:PIA14229.1 clathrin adaptor, mu subunit [Coemansia reversa NRRL 1564]
MDSLFILNTSGTPLIEKHWSDELSIRRASLVVVPAFVRHLHSVAALRDVEPVWSSPQDTVCIHIQRGDLIYLGVVSHEISPIEVIEFLEGVVQALSEYIGQLSEVTIKENFVTVYELLSEMVDSGSIVTTDTAVLRGLVPVPSLVNRVIENVSGIGIGPDKRPNVNTSSTPWRPQGIRHASNEFFVDIVERIDALVDADGLVVTYDVSGDIDCKSRLSGMPDLVMVLNRPEAMDDVAFHPCVRRRKWDSDRMIGFVPPDGQFKLASFHVAMDTSPRSLPLHVNAKSSRNGHVYTVEILLEPGQCNGRTIEKVSVRVPLPQQAYNIGVQCKIGTHAVNNARSPQVEWNIKSMKPGDRGLKLGSPPETGTSFAEQGVAAAFVEFEVAGYSASSIKVDALRLLRESYKLFKGVRYVTKAGTFQVRF